MDYGDALESIGRLPALFWDQPEKLTERNLMQRILVGLENLPAISPYTKDETQSILEHLPSSVRAFFESEDHGLAHSKKVFARAMEICQAPECSDMVNLLKKISEATDEDIRRLLSWASILHDIGRLINGSSFGNHEQFGAYFAKACFPEISDFHRNSLFAMIANHDYIIVSPKAPIPKIVLAHLKNILTDIFRLADKTSLSATEEINRYFKAGQRIWKEEFNKNLFNPAITLKERLAWMENCDQSDHWDQWQFNSIFFMIDDHSWMYQPSRLLYRRWADDTTNGKAAARKNMFQFLAEAGIDPTLPEQALDSLLSHYGIQQYK